MPSSRPNAVPVVVHLIKQLKPASILDVGVGFGKWGHLFREYTDIVASQDEPTRYHRPGWKVRIDGIEGYSSYITDMHRYLYNEIFVGDVRELVKESGNYDIVFLGDIIEHLTKEDGIALLHELIKKANKAVILSTPKYDTGQEALCENELERHLSLWSMQDFLSFPNSYVATITQTLLIAVILKDGVPVPRIDVEVAGRPRTVFRRMVGRVRKGLRSIWGANHAGR